MAGGSEHPSTAGNADAAAGAIERTLTSGLLPARARVLVALSGGRDSASLLHAMSRLGAWSLSAAVVDHRLHPASIEQAATAAESASALGLPSRVLVVDGQRPEPIRGGPEAAARAARYRLLQRHAIEVAAEYIVTAHTADDQAETLLMRLGEGTGLRGLAGIPEQRGPIVRPWLTVSRADVGAYAALHGVPYVEDPTNSDPRFLRNAVRGAVLPAMADCFDPNWSRRAARTAQNARGAAQLLEWLLEQRPDLIRRTSNRLEVSRDALRELPRGAGRALIDRALSIALDGGRRRRHHVDRLLDLADGQVCSLPGGWAGRGTRTALVIEEVPRQCTPSGPLRIDGPGRYQWARWSLAVRAGRRADEPGAIAIGAEHAPFPWIVRSARTGERLRQRGAPGSKKLSRLYADRHVPPRWRTLLPVLESDGRLIWAASLRAAEHVRVGEFEPAWLLELSDIADDPRRAPLPAG